MPSHAICRLSIVWAILLIAAFTLNAVAEEGEGKPSRKVRLFDDFPDTPTKKPATQPATIPSASPTTAPTTKPTPALKTQPARVVDLLTLLNPSMDYSAGVWTRNDDGDLQSGGDGIFWIEAPYRAPEEYDFIVEFTRKTGDTGIAQLLAVRDKKFAWVLCGSDGTRSCISTIDGKSWGNPTDRDTTGKVITGQRHRSIVRVRKKSLSVSLDDQEILHYPTRYKSFTASKFFAGRGPGLLGVGTSLSSVVFHRIEVVEVSGRGQIIERSETPLPKSEPASSQPAAVHAESTPPADGHGLRAEFFRDRAKFLQPFKVRYDPEIDFEWGEGIPDPDVPYDRFALRWTGFLRPPAAGVYRFTTYSDDGLQLWIDDKQLINGHGKKEASIDLDGRAHAIRIDFRDDVSLARASLHWRPPGENVDFVVPAECLFSNQEAAENAKVGKNMTKRLLPKGTGLQMEIFSNPRFAGTAIKRMDRQISWAGGESAFGPGLPADNFSVRWTGWLVAPRPGAYKLHATVEGRLRLRLDGKVLLDVADKRRDDQVVLLEMSDQPQHLIAEFSSGVGAASVGLRWEQIGGFKDQLIPSEAFFTDKASDLSPPTLRGEPLKKIGNVGGSGSS